MFLTTILGLDYLAGWIHVLAVRRGWWASPYVGNDHRRYRATVFWDGSVEWSLK
jgi:hypothetical protein